MKKQIWLCAVISGLGLLPAVAAAAPYTGLVVFGDSLSDVGNDAIITPELSAFGITPTPGPYYYNGRFSNGPIYVDDLAQALSLPAPQPSLAGGTDYAYGDARTSGSSALQRTVLYDVDEQVSAYLSSTSTPNASTLYDLFAGANDLIASPTAATAVTAAGNIATDVNTLYAAGARQFLIPNLPPLGFVPEFNTDPVSAASADALSGLFNSSLATDLTAAEATDPGIAIHVVDLQTLFTEVEADPALFGLTDVTDSAAPGLEPGATSYDTSLEVSDPNQYLFWDDIHPTTAGHALLAQAAEAAAVPEPASVGLFAAAGMLLSKRRRSR
jgi:outer membrane lipase/esterase